MAWWKTSLFTQHFIEDVTKILQDFFLVALIILLLRAMQWLLGWLKFPGTIRDLLELIDACSKLALLSLLAVALFFRFYKRTMTQP